MPDPAPPPQSAASKRRAEYTEALLRALVLTIPLAAIAKVNDAVSARLFSQPWKALWFLIPIAIVAWMLRAGIVVRHGSPMNRRVLGFLGAYILIFVVAEQASILDVRRELTAFGTRASERWLTPVSWGDWRYRWVERKDEDEIAVVLVQPAAARSLIEGRKEIVDLITLAAREGATGVALDMYFEGSSPLDPLLCHAINASPIPVFIGFNFERIQGRISERKAPDSLQGCVTPAREGHLAGLLDFDLVARDTPLYFRNNPNRPALGLAVARSLSGATRVEVPPDGVLRFIAPVNDPFTARLGDLQKDSSLRGLLRNRFVMAGEESEQDSFDTVFGRKPGIMIHAYVAHSLRNGHFFQRHSWWLGLAVLLVFCYWLTVWCVNGAPARRLVALCVGASAAIILIAIISARLGPYWFDVIYPATAVWLLLPIVIGLRPAIAPPQ